MMSKQKAVAGDLEVQSSLAYFNLARLAKIILVLPHSNADPERLFSMLGKIETQSRSQLSPSTASDLLTVKVNHDAPCYLSQDLVTNELLHEAKSATRRSLQKHAASSSTVSAE